MGKRSVTHHTAATHLSGQVPDLSTSAGTHVFWFFSSEKNALALILSSAGSLFECAPAKINLTLLVTGKRADGYHLLDSLVVFAGAHDRLSATPADDLTLEIVGPFGAKLASEPDNLVLRAARDLAASAGLRPSARLRLEKHLPVASGIGGGSSDAAAALRLLSRLWGVQIPDGLAATLGADVPVCLDPRPRRMTGIGEALTAAPGIPTFGILLVNPGVALATKAVFGARANAVSMPAAFPDCWPDAASMAADLASWGNDLQPPAIKLCPEVGTVLETLRAVPGCRLARMSGSGATCFAVFDTPADAIEAATHVSRPAWWCWGGAPWPHQTGLGLYAAPGAT
jgi:4-diphosphocytidyl-2-C-methyl-D-erythritol kinase